MLPLLVLLGTIAGAWYLLIVRPQREQQTRHGRLVDQLQVGDHVLTVGGIYGRVVQLDGSGVVLELAPGLTTRISTDGVARIVQGAEASLPTHTPIDAAATITPRTTQDDDMQQHHQPPQQAPQHVSTPQPQLSYQAPAAPMMQQPVMPVAQPMQQPVQQPMTTIRAAVAPAPVTWEPRPWQNVDPVTPQSSAIAQYEPQLPSPPPMPVYAPFAQVAAPAPAPGAAPVFAPAPVQMTPPLVPATAMPQQAAPVAVAVAEPAPVAVPLRTHSRAPQGMGSSLRLDDPSLRDTMIRARGELASLAEEYRRHVAPLVQVEEPAPVMYQQAPVGQPVEPVLVGHDPRGVPLFAAPGSPVAMPIEQYPVAARPAPAPSAIPRPVVPMQQAGIDPALSRSAFQRRTPYAPDPALVPATDQAIPAHA